MNILNVWSGHLLRWSRHTHAQPLDAIYGPMWISCYNEILSLLQPTRSTSTYAYAYVTQRSEATLYCLPLFVNLSVDKQWCLVWYYTHGDTMTMDAKKRTMKWREWTKNGPVIFQRIDKRRAIGMMEVWHILKMRIQTPKHLKRADCLLGHKSIIFGDCRCVQSGAWNILQSKHTNSVYIVSHISPSLTASTQLLIMSPCRCCCWYYLFVFENKLSPCLDPYLDGDRPFYRSR